MTSSRYFGAINRTRKDVIAEAFGDKRTREDTIAEGFGEYKVSVAVSAVIDHS